MTSAFGAKHWEFYSFSAVWEEVSEVTVSLVIGGSRFVGPRLVGKLLQRDHQVIVFNRGNRQLEPEVASKVQFVQGDRNAREDLARAAAIGPDFVFDMCCYGPGQATLAVDLFQHRVKRYVYVSSVASYRAPRVFPIQEADDLGPWALWGSYGLNKAKTDNVFLDVYRNNGFPITIVRPTYILGTGNHVEREAFFFSRLYQDLPIVLPGDGRALVQFVFADEVAEALLRLTEVPETTGEAYNCAGDQFITLRGFARLCGQLVGKDATLLFADLTKFDISQAPYTPSELSPFANEHCVVSNCKLKQATQMRFKSIEAGLAEFLQWYLSRRVSLPIRIRPKERDVLRHYGFEPVSAATVHGS